MTLPDARQSSTGCSDRKAGLDEISLPLHTNRDGVLAAGIQAHWYSLLLEEVGDARHQKPQAGAVDGSRATRALSIGVDWVNAQALPLGPNGLRQSAVDTPSMVEHHMPKEHRKVVKDHDDTRANGYPR